MSENRRLCLSAPTGCLPGHRRGRRTGVRQKSPPVRPRYHTPALRGLSTNWVDGSDLTGAKRLRLLTAQAIHPTPTADNSDQNGALAIVPPLDTQATTASGPILRWSASRPRESVQPYRQTRTCVPSPTTAGQFADKQLSNVGR